MSCNDIIDFFVLFKDKVINEKGNKYKGYGYKYIWIYFMSMM